MSDPTSEIIARRLMGDLTPEQADLMMDAVLRIQKHPTFFCPYTQVLLDCRSAVMVQVYDADTDSWLNPVSLMPGLPNIFGPDFGDTDVWQRLEDIRDPEILDGEPMMRIVRPDGWAVLA